MTFARIALAIVRGSASRRRNDRARIHRELFQASPAANAAHGDCPGVVSARTEFAAPTPGHPGHPSGVQPRVGNTPASVRSANPVQSGAEAGSSADCEMWETGHDMGLRHAAELFPQHTKPVITPRERRCGTEHCEQPVLRWHDSMQTWQHTKPGGCTTPTPA